ncbi:MAG: hypothetical protein HPY55_07740 [Firmicutes bacterium]|nr:hypothetical protein [Bacillota bacterium]
MSVNHWKNWRRGRNEPVARVVLGKPVAALAYVIPFSLSSAVGAGLGLVLVVALHSTGFMRAAAGRSTRKTGADNT